MTEKRKNDWTGRSSPVGALILIGIGVVFLLINTGVLSFSDIGEFFGSFGRAFGEFFGSLGGAIGAFFGGLGSLIGRLWPLALIIIGVALLFWRKPGQQAK
jgi:hypothetical protein